MKNIEITNTKQNNKNERITLFLKQLSLLFNSKEITLDKLYLELINYDIPQEERDQKVELELTKLKDNSNISISINSNYYNITSKKLNKKIIYHPINIYIPLKKIHYEENIEKIFNYISKKEISYESKLLMIIRQDNFIIKLNSIEETEQVISFIKNNIPKEDLYISNPFFIEDSNIALTIDTNYSYNKFLSNTIFNYLKKINNNKNLPSYLSFKEYIKEELNNLNPDNLNLYIPNNTIYYSLQYKEKKYIYEFYDIVNKNGLLLLKEIINEMIKKYGISNTQKALINYKKTKKAEYITRNNNLRTKVTSATNFNQYLDQLTENQLTKLIKEMALIQEKPKELKIDKKFLLENISIETYKKAKEKGETGYDQVAISLINLSKGKYNYLTRTNNIREQAKKNILKEEVPILIRETLEEKGYIIENDIDLYYLYAGHIVKIEKKEGKLW